MNFQIICCSHHIGLTFYKGNCMDIITTFGVRGKIEPKNGPEGNGFFGGLLKKWLLLSGDSKSLALLGYCYTIEGHPLILHCQNWWTLPLKRLFYKHMLVQITLTQVLSLKILFQLYFYYKIQTILVLIIMDVGWNLEKAVKDHWSMLFLAQNCVTPPRGKKSNVRLETIETLHITYKISVFYLPFRGVFRNQMGGGWFFCVVKLQNDRLIDWLTDWLIDWLTDWLIGQIWLLFIITDWLINWLTDWMIECLTDLLIYWFTDGLVDWLTGWQTGWLSDSLIVWFTDLLIDWTDWLDWLTDWSNMMTFHNDWRTDWWINWLTYRMIECLTDWPIYWLTDLIIGWLFIIIRLIDKLNGFPIGWMTE